MTKALRRKLGARIRSARQSAGLSQEALANLIERTSESISNIERGGQLPGIDTLIALSGALKLPLSELLQHVDDDRDVSKERALTEARLADLVRTLSDEAVGGRCLHGATSNEDPRRRCRWPERFDEMAIRVRDVAILPRPPIEDDRRLRTRRPRGHGD